MKGSHRPNLGQFDIKKKNDRIELQHIEWKDMLVHNDTYQKPLLQYKEKTRERDRI